MTSSLPLALGVARCSSVDVGGRVCPLRGGCLRYFQMVDDEHRGEKRMTTVEVAKFVPWGGCPNLLEREEVPERRGNVPPGFRRRALSVREIIEIDDLVMKNRRSKQEAANG